MKEVFRQPRNLLFAAGLAGSTALFGIGCSAEEHEPAVYTTTHEVAAEGSEWRIVCSGPMQTHTIDKDETISEIVEIQDVSLTQPSGIGQPDVPNNVYYMVIAEELNDFPSADKIAEGEQIILPSQCSPTAVSSIGN